MGIHLRFAILGFTTAQRSFQRSILAVVSIALVTLTVVSAGALGLGTPGGASLHRRQFIGGDILIFPEALALDSVAAYPNPRWELYQRSPDRSGLLGVLLPEIIREGVMVDSAHQLNDLSGVKDQIQTWAGVSTIYPVYEMPALLSVAGGGEIRTAIRARFPEVDRMLGFDQRIVEGNYFSDSSGPQALAENWTPDISGGSTGYFAYDRLNGKRLIYQLDEPVIATDWPNSPGTQIRVRVPEVRRHSGLVQYDFTQLHQVGLELAGLFQLDTALRNWSTELLGTQGIDSAGRRVDTNHPAHYSLETLHWTTSQLQVPWDTFRAVSATVGDPEPEPLALVVVVETVGEVEGVVEKIRNRLGKGTIISVNQWFASQDLVVEPMLMVPPDDIIGIRTGMSDYTKDNPRSFSVPAAIRSLVIVLTYFVGGAIFAGNTHMLLVQRRKEIAVMKVLGATTAQVLTVLMSELVLISVGGAVVGLAIISPLLLWHYGTSLSAAGTLAWVGILGARVIAMAIAISALFGGVPALSFARQSLGQVIYDE